MAVEVVQPCLPHHAVTRHVRTLVRAEGTGLDHSAGRQASGRKATSAVLEPEHKNQWVALKQSCGGGGGGGTWSSMCALASMSATSSGLPTSSGSRSS